LALGVPVRDEEEGGGDSVFKRITEKFNKLQIMVHTSEIERKEGQDEEQDELEFSGGKDLPDYLRFPSHVDSLKNEGVIEFPHRLDKWTAGLLVVSFNKVPPLLFLFASLHRTKICILGSDKKIASWRTARHVA